MSTTASEQLHLVEFYEGLPRPSDADTLIKEANRYLSDTFYQPIDVSSSDYVALAVNQGRHIKGVLAATVAHEFVTIQHLLVSRESKGQGIGGTLMSATIIATPIADKSRFSLVSTNEACAFYEGLGFQQAVSRGVYYAERPWLEAGIEQRKQAGRLALLTREC